MSDVVLPVEILYANGVGVLSSMGDYYPLSIQKRIQVALPILPSVAFVIPLHYPLFIEKRVPIYASALSYTPSVIPVYYDFQNSKKVKLSLPYLGELSSHTSSEFVPFDIPMVSMSKLNRKDILIPAYSSWLEFPVDAYDIGLPPVDMGGRDCESSVSLHLGNSCDADKIESFSVNKRSSVLAKDIFIGEYIFVEKTEEDYQCTKNAAYGDSLDVFEKFNLYEAERPYWLRVMFSNRELIRVYSEPLDTTIIQVYNKLKPDVYSPERILTDLLSPMESIAMDVLDYSLMESPFLYSVESPYIHIGDKINKTMYPSSPISLTGKASRKFYR